MQLSVREVFQLSDRSLRAAGVAAGPAAAAAEALWWTEVYRGEGLTLLSDLLDDIEAVDPAAIELTAASDAAAVLDGADQPALVSGTPTLDLCCVRASQHGHGLAFATLPPDDHTIPTVGNIAYRAAERGHLTVVMATDADGRSRTVVATPDQPHPLLAEVELATPPAGYATLAAILDAGLHERQHGPLTQAVFTAADRTEYPAADRRLVNRLLDQALEPAAPDPDPDPGAIVVCFDPDRPAPTRAVREPIERAITERTDAFTEVYRPAAVADRAETLLQNGIEIEEDVWRPLFEQSSGILAPPFEGSHQGAGFEINE
ncbi:MAG: hypothetical protein ABEJ43_03640 [Haloferacaceae archaeon]